jgi:sulfofructose kinase
VNIAGIGQSSIDYIGFIEKYPPEDTKCEVSQWHISGGGPVPTALVALSRFGMSTRFMGKIGSDEAGKIIKDGLIKEKINITYLIEQEGAHSQIAFIVVNKNNGKRTIFWSKTTAQPFKKDDLSVSFLDKINFLHLDGYEIELSVEAAYRARQQSIPVMLDAGRMRDDLYNLIPLCDYVVCSEQFSYVFGRNDHETTLSELLKMGVKTATVTLGVQGSLTASNREKFSHLAYPVDVVDTTGAGDIFHAGYIYGLLKNWSLKETVSFASAVSALNCRQIGGRGVIPTITQARSFMKKARTLSQVST